MAKKESKTESKTVGAVMDDFFTSSTSSKNEYVYIVNEVRGSKAFSNVRKAWESLIDTGHRVATSGGRSRDGFLLRAGGTEITKDTVPNHITALNLTLSVPLEHEGLLVGSVDKLKVN